MFFWVTPPYATVAVQAPNPLHVYHKLAVNVIGSFEEGATSVSAPVPAPTFEAPAMAQPPVPPTDPVLASSAALRYVGERSMFDDPPQHDMQQPLHYGRRGGGAPADEVASSAAPHVVTSPDRRHGGGGGFVPQNAPQTLHYSRGAATCPGGRGLPPATRAAATSPPILASGISVPVMSTVTTPTRSVVLQPQAAQRALPSLLSGLSALSMTPRALCFSSKDRLARSLASACFDHASAVDELTRQPASRASVESHSGRKRRFMASLEEASPRGAAPGSYITS